MGGAPNAVSVSPSKVYLGDDGNWSVFEISVGSPPQTVRVIPSTLVPSTWVVSSLACTLNDIPGCSSYRGDAFDQTQSKTWKPINTFTLGVETLLGWDENDAGNFGYDSVTLESPQGVVSIPQTVVASYNTTDLYVGILGLAARNYTLDKTTGTSLLSTMRRSNQIPSLSYSFTAGAYYNSTFASLTLGGFDASLSEPGDVSFNFGPDEENYLNVGLQSISYTASGAASTELLDSPLTANIDSTISDFWLPNATCNAIRDAFGLQFDTIRQLFTLNDTQHATNLKNNPQASFRISNSAAGGPSVDINMPYAAFNTSFIDPNNAESPFLYTFPLKIAQQANQYTLGRALLQEAVLTVDFERRNFTLAQVLPPASRSQAQIMNINSLSDASSTGGVVSSPTSSANPNSTSVTTVPAPGSSFPTGAIAGIVIAVVAIAAGIFAYWFIRRRRRNQLKNHHGDAAMAAVTKPLVPELPVKSPDADYFSTPAQHKPLPPYTVTASEVPELDSPKLYDTATSATAAGPSDYTIAASLINPAELPAGSDPTASELNSRRMSMNSVALGPHASNFVSPNPTSPSAVSGADGPFHSSHLEPASPSSARTVPITPVGRAHIISHSSTSRSPRHGSPTGSQDNTGLTATIGSTGIHGLGVYSSDEIHRQNSRRSSASQSTLIGGLSGRASPDGGAPTNPSAFASPVLLPFQRPSAHGQVPGMEVESPDELEEDRQR